MSYEFQWIAAPQPSAAERDRFAACWRRLACDQQPECRIHCCDQWGQFNIGFNASSIGTFRQRLLDTGMGFDAEPGPYPRLSDGPESIAEKDEADLQWRSQRVPGRRGIPLFKFRSNDEWVVTVPEIEEAIAAYQAAPEQLRTDLEEDRRWRTWLAWVGEAAQRGGFTVS